MTIDQLTNLADEWQQASHHDAFGMGAGSGTMAASHDRAKARFLAGLDTTRPAEVANALVELRDTKKKLVSERKDLIRTMRDGIIGAIQDLRANPDEVQVMMRWSKEFYEMIEKEGKPDAS
jgi:hypothetical protein